MSLVFKVIVAGGRDFTNQDVCDRVLNKAFSKMDRLIEVVCGEAKGADTCGKVWAQKNNKGIKSFPANWKDIETEPVLIRSNEYGQYNALAGMVRNHKMGDYAEALVAFWDGRSKGTKDMIEYSREIGLRVLVFDYEGVPIK